MFKTKITFRFFAEYDRNGIIEYLNKMAAKGWILKSRNGVAYKFVKTDKPYFKYDITFFADADKENDWQPNKSDIYLEMAQAGGWQFLTNDRKMMIFISENPDETPLETDPVTQLEVIHQSMLRGHIPLYLFIGTGHLLSNCDFNSYYYDWADFMLFVWALICILDVAFYFIWYLKAKKTANEYNYFYKTKTPWIILYAQPVVMLVMLISIVCYMGMLGIILIAFMAYFVVKDN